MNFSWHKLTLSIAHPIVWVALVCSCQKTKQTESDQAEEKPSSRSAHVGDQGTSRERQVSKSLEVVKMHEAHLENRLAEVRKLIAMKLKDDEVTQLLDLVTTDVKQNQGAWFVVLNEILEATREAGTYSEHFSQYLISLIENDSLDNVIRDYAIQHGCLWISSPDADLPIEPSVDKRNALFSVVLDVIETPGNLHADFTGTAIASLSNALEFGEFPDSLVQRFHANVLAVASGDMPSANSVRLSAIQTAAQNNDPGIADVARQILRGNQANPSTSMQDVVLSSIAALGMTGASVDQNLLDEVETQYPNFHHAILESKKKISQK